MDLGAILRGGLSLLLIIVVIAYLAYMVGLIFVLKRLDRLRWQAFIPVLNYYALVKALGAPTRWFFISLIPYLGLVHLGSILIRLGAIFGKSTSFSLFWLAFGACIGMPILARSPTFHKDLLDQPIKLLDVRDIRRKNRHRKAAKK